MESAIKIHCEQCQDAGEINGKGCQACCPHDFDPEEGNMCLGCDKGGTEDLVARAEWLMENDR